MVHHTNFTWPSDLYFWKNNYGTIDTNVACGEEKESLLVAGKKNRSLSNFGCFGAAAITPARNYIRCFDYGFVKKFTTDCQKRRAARGRVFNGYWADHVIESANVLTRDKRKTAFDYINELNFTPTFRFSSRGDPGQELRNKGKGHILLRLDECLFYADAKQKALHEHKSGHEKDVAVSCCVWFIIIWF